MKKILSALLIMTHSSYGFAAIRNEAQRNLPTDFRGSIENLIKEAGLRIRSTEQETDLDVNQVLNLAQSEGKAYEVRLPAEESSDGFMSHSLSFQIENVSLEQAQIVVRHYDETEGSSALPIDTQVLTVSTSELQAGAVQENVSPAIKSMGFEGALATERKQIGAALLVVGILMVGFPVYLLVESRLPYSVTKGKGLGNLIEKSGLFRMLGSSEETRAIMLALILVSSFVIGAGLIIGGSNMLSTPDSSK